MNTYYAEAKVISTGEFMQDMGLTLSQVEQLRNAERNGVISDLVIGKDIDLAKAFGKDLLA